MVASIHRTPGDVPSSDWRGYRPLSGWRGYRLQDHHRDATMCCPLCVVVTWRVYRDVQVPQPFAFVARGLVGVHLLTLAAEGCAAPWIGFEVVVPGRIALLP